MSVVASGGASGGVKIEILYLKESVKVRVICTSVSLFTPFSPPFLGL